MKLSLKEFINKYEGKSVNVPWGYRGECVSLVQRYLNECHGLKLERRGNAIHYGVNLLKYKKAYEVDQAKYGDIIVWGRPYGYIDGKYYGHVAIYIDENTIFDQNNGSVKPTRTAQFRKMLNAKPRHILRMKTTLKPDKPRYEKEVYAFTSTVKDNINIRENHSTKSNIVGKLKTGETYNYIKKYNDGLHVWVSNGKTWMAVRPVKDGKRLGLWGKLHKQDKGPLLKGYAKIKKGSRARSKSPVFDKKFVSKYYTDKKMKYRLNELDDETWVYFPEIATYVEYKDVIFL